jgi:hypothetical protein
VKAQLLSDKLWRRLSSMARRVQGQVAVPYFGTGGAELLPLRPGSLLVVRFDTETVRSGQTNPSEIIKLLKRGVEIHACRNLHAKVFVLGDTAIVGSSNVSRSSAKHLIETAIATGTAGIVSEARRFVESLRGDPIGMEFARRMKKLYRPPRNGLGGAAPNGARPAGPLHSRMWAVPLERSDWDDQDFREQRQARQAARGRRQKPRITRIEDFLWPGAGLLDRLAMGHRFVMLTDESNGKVLVSPPGRVLSIRQYTVRGKRRGIVVLELPGDARNRSVPRVIRSIGPAAKMLKHLASAREIRNGMLASSLARMWPL